MKKTDRNRQAPPNNGPVKGQLSGSTGSIPVRSTNNMKIKKRYPYREDQYWEIPDSELKFVAGKEGVFAVWRVGEIIYFAAGDDGSWWEIGSYHEHWIPQITRVLNEIIQKEGN